MFGDIIYNISTMHEYYTKVFFNWFISASGHTNLTRNYNIYKEWLKYKYWIQYLKN